MKLINKDAVEAMIDKIYDEGYKFLPSDLVESVDDFYGDLLRALDTLEEEVDFEYVRKDVFIEKAVGWIDYQNRNGGCNFRTWENDFRKEMEKTEEWEKDFR